MEKGLIAGICSILGLLGLNGIIINSQNKRIEKRQEIVVCDERYKLLVDIKDTLKKIKEDQGGMKTDIAVIKKVVNGKVNMQR